MIDPHWEPESVPLSELLRYLPDESPSNIVDKAISGLKLDSRQIRQGDLFFALRGTTKDGHRFIQDAIQRGAAAVVGEESLAGLPVPYIKVGDSRRALAHLSAAFYDHPARKLTVIGITGTDGKTTTANIIFQILKFGGIRAGMISTVSAQIGDQHLDTGFHVTTPEAPDVQAYLSQMVDAGLTHVILEATSHGLAQHRLTACEFDMAIVTNITHEHLDYHDSYIAYREAKAGLFTSIEAATDKPFKPPRGAVLNRDDESYDYLSRITTVPTLCYGVNLDADVRSFNELILGNGIQFTAHGSDLGGSTFEIDVNCPLLGLFNVYNCLAAITLTGGIMGIDPADVRRGLAEIQDVPGRMERIDMGQEFSAIVDFAHTPNALQRTLETARQLTGGRVIALFGSAGLRDREKRFLMAEISIDLADFTILTAEDPRSESLNDILSEMARGAVSHGGVEGKTFWRVPDRREAIRFAFSLTEPGDLVIACGKGHEQSMCFGETEYPWDDRVAMRAALAEYLDVPGPKMPYLPISG
jgi:UDP-N-acetylmuramoyl-L-alanyl-D-glutamate--2,6-diaminopimelate ligase